MEGNDITIRQLLGAIVLILMTYLVRIVVRVKR